MTDATARPASHCAPVGPAGETPDNPERAGPTTRRPDPSAQVNEGIVNETGRPDPGRDGQEHLAGRGDPVRPGQAQARAGPVDAPPTP